MKESELKEHELLALNCYRLFEKQKKDGMLSKTSKTGALYQFGKEIAEKLEPELKSVDMSVLLNSGIDCLFSMRAEFNNPPVMCHLKSIGSNLFISKDDLLWNYCKPRMNYWFSGLNFNDAAALVEALEEAGFIVAKVKNNFGDIEALKIMDKKPENCWPWEVK